MTVSRSASFHRDFALLALWYVREAGPETARRYREAVDSTLSLLAAQPGLGRVRQFTHPRLKEVRSYAVERPFNRLLIFYRLRGDELLAVRLMHGARDLPRRLAE